LSTTFVVNADDFGLTPEINQGILEAHTRGVVTSTSVMTNMPHFEAIRVAPAPVTGNSALACICA
jgi:predicted glycoside hydrolase/deacetylase ChbG (UPF0249 family)